MAGTLNVNLQEPLNNRPDVFNVRTQNRDFTTEEVSEDEATLFEEQFNTLINDFDSRLISELFAQRSDIIAHTLSNAKQEFGDKRFGGINASDNEIAFDVIRPGHIYADPDDGALNNTWQYEHDAAGWNDWIGDGGDNNYRFHEDQVTVVIGFLDQVTPDTVQPPTSGINVNRFGRNVDMLPKDLHDARVLDNENDILIQALPTIIGSDRDEAHIRLRSDYENADNPDFDSATGAGNIVTEPRLLGITFGLGAYMNQEDFS